MTHPATSFRELSAVLVRLSGAPNLRDDRAVGTFLAAWTLSSGHARGQFNHAMWLLPQNAASEPALAIKEYASVLFPPKTVRTSSSP